MKFTLMANFSTPLTVRYLILAGSLFFTATSNM